MLELKDICKSYRFCVFMRILRPKRKRMPLYGRARTDFYRKSILRPAQSVKKTFVNI